eukprot:360313-Chlamydomonas_euryale.AAC.3
MLWATAEATVAPLNSSAALCEPSRALIRRHVESIGVVPTCISSQPLPCSAPFAADTGRSAFVHQCQGARGRRGLGQGSRTHLRHGRQAGEGRILITV